MEPTRILFLAANPRQTERLFLDEEVRAVSERLQASGAADHIELRVAWAVRAEEIPALLLKHRPHIVHFSGHGSPAGELLLLGSDLSAPTPVSPQTLRRIFEALNDDLRCVVLSACYSALQAEAVAQVIPCVVGMAQSIQDNAARAFAVGFYQALAFGRSIAAAFSLGRTQIELAQQGEQREVPLLLLKPGMDAERMILFPGSGTPSTSSQTQAPAGENLAGARPARLLLCFSPQDAAGKDELSKQLVPLLRGSALSLWTVDDIPLGAPAAQVFTQEATQADAALLLLSAEFLADHTLTAQMDVLREQHRRRGMRLIPVVWRACGWQQVDWLKPLTPAPRDGTPLKSLTKAKRESALLAIVRELAPPPAAAVNPPEPEARGVKVPSRPPAKLPTNHTHAPSEPVTTRRADHRAEPPRPTRRRAAWSALLQLDREQQYGKLLIDTIQDRASNRLVLLHGQPEQNVTLFIKRVEEYLRDDAGCEVLNLPMLQNDSRASSAAMWSLHLKHVLEEYTGDSARPVAALLRDISRRSPLLLSLVAVDNPLKPLGVLSPAQRQGLKEFLTDALPRHLAGCRRIAVFIAIEHRSGDTSLLMDVTGWAEAAWHSSEASRTHTILSELKRPSWPEVEAYIRGYRPPLRGLTNILQEAQAAYVQLRPEATFEELAQIIDDLVSLNG